MVRVTCICDNVGRDNHNVELRENAHEGYNLRCTCPRYARQLLKKTPMQTCMSRVVNMASETKENRSMLKVC